MSKDTKKYYQLGQYFTTNNYLKESVYKLIRNDSKKILEPSMGRGDLVEYVIERNQNVEFDLYEIDKTIEILSTIDLKKIKYGDFLKKEISETYDTIIGNPPFVKTKKGNLYLDFIYKCYQLLNINGELIFIVPSDFIKLTRSGKIITEMLENGTFTDIIHPNDESLFENASIDVIVFRYCKNSDLSNKILVNNEEKFLVNTDGILTFSNTEQKNLSKFSDYFDIFVGMVTGREKVFKNDLYGNITLLNGKNVINKYILIDEYPTQNNKLNEYMLSNKSDLINRRIRKFTEKNWYEWGALRNYKKIKQNNGKNCIYVSNMTRASEICFQGKVQYFGGGLIIMIPKQKINLHKLVDYMNSDLFKNNYMYSGRFKIGHKQLSNSLFDFSDII